MRQRSEFAATRDSGSDQAFTALYRDEYPGLVRLAWLLTGDAAATEDVVQHAFTRLYGQSTTIERPGAWLHTTVVNACRDHHRRRARAERLLASASRYDHVGLGASDDRELVGALAALPFGQRAVLVLRYYLDLHDGEIAARLGIRRATVRTRTARALTTLRKQLDR